MAEQRDEQRQYDDVSNAATTLNSLNLLEESSEFRVSVTLSVCFVKGEIMDYKVT